MPQLFVAGFQTERGMAQYFATQMQYLRPGVQLADIAGGNFSEILLAPQTSTALVLFEARRYSRLTFLLAQEAHQAGIPITLIDLFAVEQAFRLTSFFFTRHVYEPRGVEPPDARSGFIAALRKHHAVHGTSKGDTAA